jgi:biopolymer transport protein ExbD
MALEVKFDEDEIISGINVTPLVDVAFVVLIIFIVTASILLKDNIPINLPESQSADEASRGMVNLAITEQGKIFVNGTETTLEKMDDLVAEAREAARKQGFPPRAFVSADVKAQYGVFARVIDNLRLLEIYDIALDTQPVEVK